MSSLFLVLVHVLVRSSIKIKEITKVKTMTELLRGWVRPVCMKTKLLEVQPHFERVGGLAHYKILNF